TTALDTWVAFLTRHELFDLTAIPNTIPQKTELNKALHVLEVMNLKSEEHEAYEVKIKWFRTEVSAIREAEKKAEKRGLERGLQQGLQQGEQVGIEKGEHQQSRKIAKNLLEAGLDEHLVLISTGLTIEEIKSLKL